MPRKPNVSRQTFLLLATLAQNPSEWQYGYDLSRRTELSAGTMYPILARLASAGLLEACWNEPQPNGRPPRHMYRLTAGGLREALEAGTRIEAGASLKPGIA